MLQDTMLHDIVTRDLTGYAGDSDKPLEAKEQIHTDDARLTLLVAVSLIFCVLVAYQIKVRKLYHLPESVAAILVGAAVGGAARFYVDDVSLLKVSPEIFFFVLLPPIVFEAGYRLERHYFFDNFGAVTLFATLGTMISTFFVGYSVFFAARWGLITNGVDPQNPMEALLFGSLISATDPVATLSIMGSPELQCDETLYSLVFGESVLNDAVAIVLFKTFLFYYDPNNPDLEPGDVITLLTQFFIVSVSSIAIGVGLGLLQSYIYKNSDIWQYPKLEMALLFLFCYCCYATAEVLSMSGIMALFFNGIILSHYNSYNLSPDSHTTSEYVFSTLAVVSETLVFLYMGVCVSTGEFRHWNMKFASWALLFCLVGRALNIFVLSFCANFFRRKRNKITWQMQVVLWFSGLRGAIAFALSENMPGHNRETYVAVTLGLCIFTTVVCGGLTETMLSKTGMKQEVKSDEPLETTSLTNNLQSHVDRRIICESFGSDIGIYGQLLRNNSMAQQVDTALRESMSYAWRNLDDAYLRPLFGGYQSL